MRARYLRHEVVVITMVGSIVYVAAGLAWHPLLNWIVGPAWPIACVWAGPPLVRRVLRWEARLPDGTGSP